MSQVAFKFQPAIIKREDRKEDKSEDIQDKKALFSDMTNLLDQEIKKFFLFLEMNKP
jgi:hypothetical protein